MRSSQTPWLSACIGVRVVMVTEMSKIKRLVDYLCPETCKQYNWINTKYISLSEHCEYLSSWEHRSFISSHAGFPLLDVILGKYQSIFYSSYFNIISLQINKFVDLRGIYKILIWACHSVSLSTWDFGNRFNTLTGKKKIIIVQLPLCHPHETLLMLRGILQFKLVDTCIQVQVSFQMWNG